MRLKEKHLRRVRRAARFGLDSEQLAYHPRAGNIILLFKEAASAAGVPYSEKRLTTGSWECSSIALGRVFGIRFRKGFKQTPAFYQAYIWAHEWHHIEWQLLWGFVPWVTLYSRPRWRWVFELSALLGGWRVRIHLRPSELEKLRDNIEAITVDFIADYNLTAIGNVRACTTRMLSELVEAYDTDDWRRPRF